VRILPSHDRDYSRLQEQAIRKARDAGQAKMLEMMKAAKKRMKRLSVVPARHAG
jgi:hypothetical protein